MKIGAKLQKVELLIVDAPACVRTAAKKQLSKLVKPGMQVSLIADATQPNKAASGALLRYLSVPPKMGSRQRIDAIGKILNQGNLSVENRPEAML